MGDYELYHAARKTHKYIKKIGNRYFYTQQEIQKYLEGKKKDVTFEKNTYSDGTKDYRIDFNKHDGGHKGGGWSDGVGIRTGNKTIEVYNTTNKKYQKNPEVRGDHKGRFRTEYAEDGSRYSLDYSDKKTFRQKQRREVEQNKNFSDYMKEIGRDNSDAERYYQESKAELDKAEKRDARQEKRKKKIKAAYEKARKKTVSSLKKQSERGKKAVSKLQGAKK